MNYSQRPRALREDNDKTQKEIATILNTTQQYYGQYELGKRALHIDHLITLCQYYKVNADYILGFKDEPLPIK